MKWILLAALNEKEVQYTNSISEINQSTADLKTLQDSNDKCLVSTYQSGNDRFRRLPIKLTVSSPIFVPFKKKAVHQQFGYVSQLAIETEEEGYKPKSQSTLSFPPDRTLIDVPRIIANTDIQHGLRVISCVDNEQFWACGVDNIMRLYNFHGELVRTSQTKSVIVPWDIAVTKNGDLVFICPTNFTVNIVTNTRIYNVIKLRKWRPLHVCSSSSGDFLVVMDNVKKDESKVVRYSDSTEKQIIQFDAKGQRLYSTLCECECSKYIVENKNLDICVADAHSSALIVVNHAGGLRFQYTDIKKHR